MRPVVVTEFITLDGVIEAPGGGDHPEAGWTFKDLEFVPEAYTVKGTEQAGASALLLGRVSFEEFAPVWPTMQEFERYNAIPKYVVSSTLTDAGVEASGWENSHLLRSLDAVAALRADDSSGSGPILVHGSATLAQGLAAAGLVDRYTLLEFPIILGRGKRLFANGGAKTALRLTATETYSNGIRLAEYEVVR